MTGTLPKPHIKQPNNIKHVISELITVLGLHQTCHQSRSLVLSTSPRPETPSIGFNPDSQFLNFGL